VKAAARLGIAPASRPHALKSWTPGTRFYLQRGVSREIARKYAQGKISLALASLDPDPGGSPVSGIASLSLTETDALAAEKLQLFHKDPSTEC